MANRLNFDHLITRQGLPQSDHFSGSARSGLRPQKRRPSEITRLAPLTRREVTVLDL